MRGPPLTPLARGAEAPENAPMPMGKGVTALQGLHLIRRLRRHLPLKGKAKIAAPMPMGIIPKGAF